MGERSSIPFGKLRIGSEHPPVIIAELSANHNGSLQRALDLVEAAAAAGCHAVKLQTYTADTMTLDVRAPGFIIEDERSLWNGRALHDLYEEAHTPWEWHAPLFARAKELGLECLSTPFSAQAVEFLEQFNPPAHKIASFELTDHALIAAAAATRRPLILSTGMANVAEIDEAVRVALAAGAGGIVLLKCTSTYPASAANSNIATIPHMRELFHTEVGLSDHTPGIGVALGAIALGATVVEKHFTMSRQDGGVDAAFSLEPAELRSLTIESERAWLGRGTVRYGALGDERGSLQFRRSIYAAEDVRAGERLTAGNIRVIRPGYGLEPKYLPSVLGRRANADIQKGTPISWDLID